MSSLLQMIPKVVLRWAGPILLLVLIVAWLLLRHRRRGTTPHCRRCDYNLTGLTSDRCPECGTEMTPAGIVYGEKVRRRWLWMPAVVCAIALVPPAMELVRWARTYDWYRLRPTSWVLRDRQ